ncbi:MAG: hypothetical protein ABSF76_10760 [Opitutaceae bacterium]|jgi:hypothetical protein
MKKTSKTSKTPAPATKLTAPAPALKSTVEPKVKKPAAPAAAPALVAKPTASRVTITAKIDIGFGNSLYVRGDSAGLTWSKGTLLDCVSSDTWRIVLSGVEKPVTFKFLLNDQLWSSGGDYVASPGDTVTVTPAF